MVESRVLPSIVDLVPSLIGYDPESVELVLQPLQSHLLPVPVLMVIESEASVCLCICFSSVKMTH
jgi:hypothetical protein